MYFVSFQFLSHSGGGTVLVREEEMTAGALLENNSKDSVSSGKKVTVSVRIGKNNDRGDNTDQESDHEKNSNLVNDNSLVTPLNLSKKSLDSDPTTTKTTITHSYSYLHQKLLNRALPLSSIQRGGLPYLRQLHRYSGYLSVVIVTVGMFVAVYLWPFKHGDAHVEIMKPGDRTGALW